MKSALLKVTFPDGKNKEIVVGIEPVEIGRNPESDIVIQRPEVSRRHCTVKYLDDQFFIIDHESANGTFLNAKKITFSPLHEGDVITVGALDDILIEFLPTRASTQIPAIKENGETSQKIFSGEFLRKSVGDSGLGLTSFSDPKDKLSSLHLQKQVKMMFQVSKLLLRSPEYQTLNRDIAKCIFDSFSADRVLLLRGNGKSNSKGNHLINIEQSWIREEEMDGNTFSQTMVNRILTEDVAIYAVKDKNASGSFVRLGITQSLAVPIRGQEKVYGAILCDTYSNLLPFSETDLDSLSVIGNQLGLAWENIDLQQEKMQAERLAAVGQAVASLAHYIKNVLACSQSGAGLVDEAFEAGNMEILGKAWTLVKNSNEKIQHLVKELLSLSKARTLVKKNEHLNLFIKGLVDQMVIPYKERITSQTFLDKNLVEVPIDQFALEDAIRNIIQNAIEAADEAKIPQLTISVTTQFLKAENKCKITIHDNGPGIPPDVLPNIWDLFYSTKGTRGSGLGMTVTQKVIEEHGGMICCESSKGQGTTFVIYLPMI